MAERAVRMFPLLAGLNVVRTWAALRVMSPDGFPIYDQSRSHPGAFVVDLPQRRDARGDHALTLAPQIAAGTLAGRLSRPFSARRFDVPAGCLRLRGDAASPSPSTAEPRQARAGDTVAAALLAAGIDHCRDDARSRARRARPTA